MILLMSDMLGWCFDTTCLLMARDNWNTLGSYKIIYCYRVRMVTRLIWKAKGS